MGFGPLRVINEDRVSPGGGFATHGHADMEIISVVLEGAWQHKDSLGTGSVIRPDEVQRMSAGSGIRHSEFNASQTEPVHFLQIWIMPDRQNIPPSYEQKAFPVGERDGRLCLVASGDGAEGSLKIAQQAKLYSSVEARRKPSASAGTRPAGLGASRFWPSHGKREAIKRRRWPGVAG